MASCDRLVAYFESVESESGQRRAVVGLVLGPLILAYAMLSPAPRQPDAELRQNPRMDWAQLILPYIGSCGVA